MSSLQPESCPLLPFPDVAENLHPDASDEGADERGTTMFTEAPNIGYVSLRVLIMFLVWLGVGFRESAASVRICTPDCVLIHFGRWPTHLCLNIGTAVKPLLYVVVSRFHAVLVDR